MEAIFSPTPLMVNYVLIFLEFGLCCNSSIIYWLYGRCLGSIWSWVLLVKLAYWGRWSCNNKMIWRYWCRIVRAVDNSVVIICKFVYWRWGRNSIAVFTNLRLEKFASTLRLRHSDTPTPNPNISPNSKYVYFASSQARKIKSLL